ncbi:unnamed protein product [Ceutorhynchus assimilis]|uniref:RING-type domain-containing protein n=1 Tax=Ceutorhynchus assimilis TaxID=467358 RepID=A0A9N9MAS6_9CUCU|nr:unnamed protein product [Ceutorhynchus assimilis]
MEESEEKCEENNSKASISEEQGTGVLPVESCTICISEMVGKFIGSPDKCRHHFCVSCLRTWSHTQAALTTCPVCRTEYTNIEVLDRLSKKCIKSIPVVAGLRRTLMVALHRLTDN